MLWPLRMVTVISIIVFPLCLYVGFRLASSLAAVRGIPKRQARGIVFLGLSFLYLLPTIVLFDAVTGTVASYFLLGPRLSVIDYIAHYPFWWGVIILVDLAALLLALDIIALPLRFVRGIRGRWLRIRSAVTLAVALALVLYVPLRSWSDTTTIRDERIEIPVASIPAGCDGLRLTLIGDLQVDRYTGEDAIRRVRAIIDGAKPELLLSAGDIVTGGKEFIGQAVDALCPAGGMVSSIAVMGDHDYWSDAESIPERLRACGWNFLDNSHTIVPVRGGSVLVTGITHIYSDRLKSKQLDSLLASAPDADLKILLSHQPAELLVEAAARCGYDVMLAGHTHGGQILFHPLGIPVTASMFETKYYSGFYRVGEMALLVTNGIGLTLAPIRFHAPAEVSSITIRAR